MIIFVYLYSFLASVCSVTCVSAKNTIKTLCQASQQSLKGCRTKEGLLVGEELIYFPYSGGHTFTTARIHVRLLQNVMLLTNQPTDSPDWPFICLDQPGAYLIFVISSTQAFCAVKIFYTQNALFVTKLNLRQNSANRSNAFCKIIYCGKIPRLYDIHHTDIHHTRHPPHHG